LTNKRIRPERYQRGTFCRGVLFMLVFNLIAPNIHAVGIHSHGDGAFHHDCLICKATVAASAVPAWRASRMDPLIALRDE
jgi:ABC-type lipoprotein release transport system permease subunit